MFLFNLTYVKPISEVERLLPAHIRFLEEQYAARKFICSGRKHPRTGGIILGSCGNRKEAERIAEQDPFFQEGVARYEITEFLPTKCLDTFQAVLEEGN